MTKNQKNNQQHDHKENLSSLHCCLIRTRSQSACALINNIYMHLKENKKKNI